MANCRWSIVTTLYLAPFLRYDELQAEQRDFFTYSILVRARI